MPKPPGTSFYPIASVSKLTGVSCHTLRVWERRYGFPRPQRTESGHRRYTHGQLQILLRVVEQLQAGRSISELIEAIPKAEAEAEVCVPSPSTSVEVVELVNRLVAGDIEGGEEQFARLARDSDTPDLILRVIEPALVDVGERWFRQECEVFQERSVSHFLRRKLEVLIDEARRSNSIPSHTMLAGTVHGDRHSGGVLMLHLLLERLGWRVLNMGMDLPVHEYKKAIIAWKPDALGLSFVLSRNINKRFQELSQIRDIPIFVGGRSILNYQSLARRYGLIPLPGPVTTAVGRLLDQFEVWTRQGGAPSDPN